jgi:hypothetical protein
VSAGDRREPSGNDVRVAATAPIAPLVPISPADPIAPGLDVDRLAGLVFELASQLHAERVHRLALERALAGAGVLPEGALRDAAADPALRERGRREVEESVARLMRVLTESADPRAPLRGSKGGT